ncbi:pre-rRNA 2'-O-ribose RNA methyltransferase FTSJ3 [Microplitis mediator]|uniref:pre-rRNA 2'-O-ribose RNA methyltransferase FTSJ3 n=1 Tax=Microplitis mediator TaxID=375433 RepID=UPI0025576CEE|nr:pre-rRNA 2'-O-ribose RNA methyltransferase FTSJ3 [Microplitis mediator]
MGKKTKVGKQRKDKYYHLAKETGFRSRAAFKLIQLNRKFEFLQKSRVCIDLCAAPGGWMQVARQNMPVSSIVIGIDLFPIRPIPGCINLTEDITTDKCRVAISKELKTWKADIVLNDGAPNVGKNWLHDAYQQVTLTLSAVKLATQFLRPGGWFVTKIFRSKDYNALLWILTQLFKKVHATKPQASRNESAEIFVVCQHYIAPDKLDPKFFDPHYVFSDLDISSNKLCILHPERRKKAKPEGYPENDYTLHHQLPASQYIAHETGIEVLENIAEIVIDDPKIAEHPKTTREILECCKDIKVLNRRDIKLLLSWWKELRKEFHGESKEADDKKTDDDKNTEAEESKKDGADDDGSDEDKEQMKIDAEVAEIKAEELRELKKKKKKAQKERQKLNERLNLKMIHKGDEGPKLECEDMFTLTQITSHQLLDQITDQLPDITATSDVESDDEKKLPKKLRYDKDEGNLDSKSLYYTNNENMSESDNDEDDSDGNESGLDLSDSEDEKSVGSEDDKSVENKEDIEDVEPNNPLITDLDYRDKSSKKINKAKIWFEKDVFKNLENDSDEEYELNNMMEVYSKKKNPGEDKIKNKDKGKKINKTDDSESDSDYDVEEKFRESNKNNKNKDKNKIEVEAKEKGVKESKKRKLNAGDLALGTLIATSKKARRDITDAAWNRYAFNDDHLPDWFAKDEERHMRKEAPVPKELVDDYKKQLVDINARPIKKVMEAKARKKKRALRKLEKAKKKTEALIDSNDLTDREKADQIKSLYKKALKPPKKEVTYVVAKKHMAQKRAARPAGLKGHYKLVDSRMKKDLRAQKAKEKTKGRGKKNRKGVPHGKPKAKSTKGKKSK